MRTDDDIILGLRKMRYMAMQQQLLRELEPIFEKYFSTGPDGILCCYGTAMKLKFAYFEALRAISNDQDKFDEVVKEMDRNLENWNSTKEYREIIEAYAKKFLGDLKKK